MYTTGTLNNCGLILERFSLLLWWILLRSDLAPFYGDLSQSEKLSEIKSPLVCSKDLLEISAKPCRIQLKKCRFVQIIQIWCWAQALHQHWALVSSLFLFFFLVKFRYIKLCHTLCCLELVKVSKFQKQFFCSHLNQKPNETIFWFLH